MRRLISEAIGHNRRERLLWELALARYRSLCRADGIFYNDLREPHFAADLSAVTLSTTDKALYAAKDFPVLGGNYFGRIGKKLLIRAFGKITTAVTPGNGTIDVYWGTGADANGTLLASSAAMTLIASQTNLSWEIIFRARCTALGTSGALEVTGGWEFNAAVVAAQNGLIPASAAAPVTVDLTAANIISLQYKRSGSTAETMTVQDLEVVALD